MSLVVSTYVPEGIIMASDSRQSITINGKDPSGKPFQMETVNSDNVTKTFLLEEHGVGISVFGQDLLGGVPTGHHIKQFREEALSEKDDVESIAKKLKKFISSEFPQANTGFHVCGYKKEKKVSVPHVWYVHGMKNNMERKNIKADKTPLYGTAWSGQGDILTSLMNPVVIEKDGRKEVVRAPAPVAWDAMALQDAIDFSIYAIRTTIDTMRFQARPKNVGGAIDVLALTPDSSRWIKKKELRV